MSAPTPPPRRFVMPTTANGTPVHRVILLWLALVPLLVGAAQLGLRLWLLEAGTPVVGVVTVAQDSCITRHRANCFLGRAVVDPRLPTHRYSTTKVPGGRFYDVGEELPMRVYPSERRLYLAAVYDPRNWLLGPARMALIAALLAFAALMPAPRKALWIVPTLLAATLTLG